MTKLSPKPTNQKQIKKKTQLKPAAIPMEVAADYEPSQLLEVLSRAQARVGTVTTTTRAAFDSLMTDAQRVDLGVRTKAIGVAKDAVAWIVQIDTDGREYPELFEFYSKTRFAYFLQVTRDLVTRVIAESGRTSEKTVSKDGATSARDQAKRAHESLLGRLHAFAGSRAKEQDAIAKAQQSVATNDTLAASIKNLVALARTFIDRKDEPSRIVAEAANLTSAFCDQALAKAMALTGAAADATEAGRLMRKDSPAVNVREGAVLREMEVAKAAVDEANDEHPPVRRLNPGPATRSVFGSRKAAAQQQQPVASPANGTDGAVPQDAKK
jgi:hypothetical protein